MLEEHSPGLIAASFFSFIAFFIGFVVNFSSLLMRIPFSHEIPDIFHERFANVTSSNILPVSPGDWSAAIWGVVYVCQFFWIVYALAAICRQTPSGPAYNNPKLLPVSVHVFFSLSIFEQVCWLLLWDLRHLSLALLLSGLATGSSLLAICYACRALDRGLPILLQESRTFDIWTIRILAHNALAVLASWVTLTMTFNLALVLANGIANVNMSLKMASLTELGLVAFLMISYVIIDLTILDRFCRYVILPYLATIVFLAAPLYKTWTSALDPVFLSLASLQGLSFMLIVVKVAVTSWRHVSSGEPTRKTTRPLASTEETKYLLP